MKILGFPTIEKFDSKNLQFYFHTRHKRATLSRHFLLPYKPYHSMVYQLSYGVFKRSAKFLFLLNIHEWRTSYTIFFFLQMISSSSLLVGPDCKTNALGNFTICFQRPFTAMLIFVLCCLFMYFIQFLSIYPTA